MSGAQESRHLVVTAIETVARDIRAYRLSPASDEEELSPFEPGAHISLDLPGGLIRDYSLCSDPADVSSYQIAVKYEAEGRGGSRAVHETLKIGSFLKVKGPENRFVIPAGAGPVLLLAGGIGITPILSMLHALRRAGMPFRLVYLVKEVEDIAFSDTLVPRAGEDIAVHVRKRSGGRYDLTTLLSGLGPDWSVMCCGPLSMIEEAQRITQDLGWSEGRFVREVFRAEAPQSRAADQAFVVTVASSGQNIEVAQDQTILEALLAAGVDVDFSCEEGTCGTCITRVLSGEVDHRDQVLMPHEQADHIVLCCSRGKSARLTLDL